MYLSRVAFITILYSTLQIIFQHFLLIQYFQNTNYFLMNTEVFLNSMHLMAGQISQQIHFNFYIQRRKGCYSVPAIKGTFFVYKNMHANLIQT